MGHVGSLLMKGFGAFVFLIVALAVAMAIVTAVVSVVATAVVTIVAALFVIAMVSVMGLATVGLVSMLRESGGADETVDAPDTVERDPEERLRERYVEGKLSDEEFERRLESLMDPAIDDVLETDPDEILDPDGYERERFR